MKNKIDPELLNYIITYFVIVGLMFWGIFSWTPLLFYIWLPIFVIGVVLETTINIAMGWAYMLVAGGTGMVFMISGIYKLLMTYVF